MRCVECIVLVVLASGLAQAAPVDCAPMPAPNPLTVTVAEQGTETGRDGVTQYPYSSVRLVWTEPTFAGNKLAFLYYSVERRDDTAGGAFEEIYTSPYQTSVNQTILANYSEPAPQVTRDCVFARCYTPGRTYTYRVLANFEYVFGCTQDDGGQTHASDPSNEAQIAMPGVDPAAPQDLVAVAETKRPRVDLSWKPPASKPQQYAIERGVVPTDGSAVTFQELVRLAGDVVSYTDSHVDPDVEYEYRVAAVVANLIGARSRPDDAYTVGKCPPARYDVWAPADWKGQSGDDLIDFHTIGFVEAGLGVDLAPITLMLGRTRWRAPATVLIVAKPPSWASGLKLEDRGSIAVAMDSLPPFDHNAFKSMSGTLTLKKQRLNFTATLADSDEGEMHTTLCATVGAGKPKAKPGDVVVVVFQCVALDAPLYSRRVAVDVVVENGTIVSKTPNQFLQLDTNVTAVDARYQLGALGPDPAGRAQTAQLVLGIALGDPKVSRQTRCRFKFVVLAPSQITQPIKFRQDERVVEIEIQPPS